MAMTNEQLDSIGAFLKTNPSQEALSAAMQQFGVGQADVDAARARTSGGAFTVGGGAQTANGQQLATDRMQQMAQAGQGVQWGNGQSEAGMIEQARAQGWSPQYMAQAMGVPVDQISGAINRYDTGVGREKELASRRAQGTDLSAPSPWGGFSPSAQATAATPAPTPNLGMGSSANTGNRAAVMPPETTGQRGMQQYNPAGMPGGGEMSRPGGGGVMIQNPDGSERPYGTPAPGGGYNPGMGNTADRAAVMPNEYNTGQRGMQPYNPGMGAQGPNPYLNQMASGMVGQVQQNFLQQTMPQLRSGAQASGQYGGSRQGIAEGVAAGNAATGLAGQLANLYGGAYNTDQANQTQRYGTNVGANVSVRGQDVSQNIAGMNNQTNMRGQDQNFALGQGNLGLGYQNSSNSYNLGMANNQTTQRGQDQNYSLGQMSNNTTQRGQDLNQQVASGQLGLGWQQAGNAYNLGLGQLNLGQQQASNAYNLGLGQLDLSNQGQNQNFYTSQRGQDLQQYQLGASLYGSGVNGQMNVGQGQYNVGQQYQNAPINAVNQYGQAISPYTGYGQTQTTSGQAGGGANGVIGGGLAGAQIANNLWRGNQANQYNQNMGVNFTAPGVYG